MNPRVWVALCAAAVMVSGCGEFTYKAAIPKKPSVEFSSNVASGADDVPVDTLVKATARHGTITSVSLESDKGNVGFAEQGRVWVAGKRLEPGVDYHLTVNGVGSDGATASLERDFTTTNLSLNEQTYPSVSPLGGETVGVGMPVIVRFDLPVRNHELYEQNMVVESSKPIDGRWAWFGDRSVHFRPRDYWPADTDVTVKVLVNSLPAGNGIYGQQDQVVKFHIGRKMVSYVDVNAHTLVVKQNDQVIRTIPVSTGDDKHRTRQGTKVIMEKLRKVDMDAATTGVDSEDPGYYNLKDVEYAMRLTNSGEFLHAAPWSVGAQGRANVSHGCTGMSTENAKWLFETVKKGDPVEYSGSSRPIEEGNGWTDWNVSWDDWVGRSALKTPEPTVEAPSVSPAAPASAQPTSAAPHDNSASPTGIRATAPPMPN